MNFTELLLIAILFFVLFDAKQMIAILRFVFLNYKKISKVIQTTKSEVEKEFNDTFVNLNSNLLHMKDQLNFKIDSPVKDHLKFKLESAAVVPHIFYTTPCHSLENLHQPELNFDAQPELFE